MPHRVTAPWAALGCALLLATACAHRGPPPPPKPEDYLGQTHPLRDRIYALDGGQILEPEQLFERLATRRFVLLGEKHDNALHHRGQAEIVRALTAAGQTPVIGWEMITTKQQQGLADWLASEPANADDLGDALGWDKTGWPSWKMYQPIADAAASAKLSMVAASIPRKELMALYGSENYLESDEAKERGVHVPLTEERLVVPLAESITESHCGYAPKEMLDAMVVVQQVKDGFMARRLVDSSDGGPAVLIAGGEHVRRSRAVPYFLRGHDGITDADIAIVAFQEVDDEILEPTGYEQTAKDFDYLWFTTRVSDSDPCEKYREQLEKMGDAHGKGES